MTYLSFTICIQKYFIQNATKDLNYKNIKKKKRQKNDKIGSAKLFNFNARV